MIFDDGGEHGGISGGEESELDSSNFDDILC